MLMDGLCTCRRDTFDKQYFAGVEPGAGEEQQRLKRASIDAHKLLLYKDLNRISLLQPTGTKSAQILLFCSTAQMSAGSLHGRRSEIRAVRKNGLINK